jgi:hypothetical protein
MVPMMYLYTMVLATLIVMFIYAKDRLENDTTVIGIYQSTSLISSKEGNSDQNRSNRQLQTLPVVGQVETLRLINANTDLPITDLVDGMIINVATQNTSNFNIQVTTSVNGTVGSVRFQYNNITNFRTESSSPFSFCGDQPRGNYRTCTELVVGQHIISAAPYTDINAKGTKGATKKISFRIINSPPTSVPLTTPPPSKAPTKFPTKAPTAAPVLPYINVTCNIPQV